MFTPREKQVNITNESEEHVIFITAILGTLAKRMGPITVTHDELDAFLVENPEIKIVGNEERITVQYVPPVEQFNKIVEA